MLCVVELYGGLYVYNTYPQPDNVWGLLRFTPHYTYMYFAADRAMREMNRKEKEIIKAYLKAVKYASQLESRVRIMLIGDGGSGGYVVRDVKDSYCCHGNWTPDSATHW